MSKVLLDHDTVVIEALEFAPRCVAPAVPEHPAEVAVLCRSCRAVRLICHPHLDALRAQLERKPRRIRVITCTARGGQAKDWDALAEVVPL